jgi:hypothetical protein
MIQTKPFAVKVSFARNLKTTLKMLIIGRFRGFPFGKIPGVRTLFLLGAKLYECSALMNFNRSWIPFRLYV